MKKNYVIPAIIVITIGIYAFRTAPNLENYIAPESAPAPFSSGHQPGLTGAPGENNCTMCHSGSVLDGSTQNAFNVVDSAFNNVTSYIPGDTYTVVLELVSNPAKKGFSSTTLDVATNTMAGSLSGMGIGGTADFMNTAMTRTYVSHTSTSNTDAVTIWSWIWIAPSTNVGDVTFYIASNSTNDDGSTAGDEIYLSNHTLQGSPGVGMNELNETITSFTSYYDNSLNGVFVKFNTTNSASMYFNLIDLNGKSVYVQDLGNSIIGENTRSIPLPNQVSSGVYVVNFFMDNKAKSAKIMIQR